MKKKEKKEPKEPKKVTKENSQKVRKRIRQVDYTEWESEDKLQELEELASQGATIACICKHMGTTPKTFYSWCEKSPLIKEAVRRGIDETIENVENALYLACVQDRNIKAITFFLTNRAPDRWRLKTENTNFNNEVIEIKL